MIRYAGFASLALAVALAAPVTLAAEPPMKKPSELKPPIVKCTGLTPAEGSISASFEVTNPNEVPLPYIGYTSDSFQGGLKEGTIAPIFRIELKTQEQWNKHSVGFCGTGIGPVTLPAKTKVTFGVALPADGWDAAKVGLSWWDPAADETKATVAWSGNISRKDIEKDSREKK